MQNRLLMPDIVIYFSYITKYEKLPGYHEASAWDNFFDKYTLWYCCQISYTRGENFFC